MRGRRNDYGAEFVLDLIFVEKIKCRSPAEDTRTPPKRREVTRIELGLRGDQARNSGLKTVTQKHTLPPDPTVMQHLLAEHQEHQATLISFACQRRLSRPFLGPRDLFFKAKL